MKNRFSLQLSPTTSPTLLASPSSGLSLKGSGAPSTAPSTPLAAASSNLTMSYDQESDIFEDITLNFSLPDGSTFSYKAKTGDTVLEVKRKLDTSKGIAARSCTLFWDGKYMMDPLSLNDIPGLVSKSEVQIEVKLSQSTTQSPQQHHMQQHHPQQYHQHFEGLKKQYIEDMQRAPYARCKSAVFATETINKEATTQVSSPHLPKKLHNGHDTVGSLSSSPARNRATIQPLPLGGLSFLTESESADLNQSKLPASTTTASPEKERDKTIQSDSSCSSISTMSSGITSTTASPITPASTLGKKTGSLLLNLKLSDISNNSDTPSSPGLNKASSDTALSNSKREIASPRETTSPSARSLVTETKDEKKERKLKEKVERRMSRRMTKIESMKDSNKPTSPRKMKPLEDFSASKRSCIVM